MKIERWTVKIFWSIGLMKLIYIFEFRKKLIFNLIYSSLIAMSTKLFSLPRDAYKKNRVC